MAVETLPQGFPEPIKPEQPKVDYSFEGQFKKRLKMEVGGKKVDYLRISPPPDKVTSDVPAVILPGFTENPELLKKLLERKYKDGRHVFILSSYPRDVLDIPLNGHPQAQEQKIAVSLTLIHEARIFDPNNPEVKRDPTEDNKVDLYGRSDGGINGTLAAEQHPEWIDNLFLIDTKLTNREDPKNLTRRFLFGHALNEAIETTMHPRKNSYIRHGIQRAFEYVALHPEMSLQEISAIAKSDIKPALKSKIRKEGVTVFSFHTTKDAIFPFDDTQREIAHQELFDYFISVGPEKRHDSPRVVINGDGSKYAPDYSPKDHASIYNDEKYINGIGIVSEQARKNSDNKRTK